MKFASVSEKSYDVLGTLKYSKVLRPPYAFAPARVLAVLSFQCSLMTDIDEKPSAILSRVSWKLPVASKAEGIYIDLQDGTRLIEAVGMTTPFGVATVV